MQKKNLKLLFLIVLYGCTLWVSKAQDTSQASKKDTNKMLHWEVASDLLWLVDKNTLPKYSLFGRYHYKTKNGKNRAIRARLGGDYRSYTNYSAVNNGGFPSELTEDIKFVLRVGYEWRKHYNKFAIFYGIDGSVDLNRRIEIFNRNYTINGVGGLYTVTDGDRDWTSQLIGFMGFQYYIMPKLSVSTEISLNMGYVDNKSLYTSPTGTTPSNFATWFVSVNPFYIFNVSYHF